VVAGFVFESGTPLRSVHTKPTGRSVWSFRKVTACSLTGERVAFLGSGPVADELHARAQTDQSLQVVGRFDAPSPAAGLLSPLIELARNREVDRVVLAIPDMTGPANAIQPVPSEASGAGPTRPTIQPQLQGTAEGGRALPTEPSIPQWKLLCKTLLDRLIAAIALFLLIPLFLLIAVIIRIDSAGPVIFRQRRHGCGTREFAILKFRTMRPADTAGELRQTLRGDSRITSVGGFLRRTSLDELPQLWNVLNGTMSLVGPRPHPVAMRTEGLLCEEIAPDYQARHRVKPGITGLAQINGSRGATATAEQLRTRVAYDLQYIEAWSLSLDLQILALTPVRLILQREHAF
jgi:lipopolysaccharide/colanic/teichoic acid biosynthesis glycosyltransferase